MANPTPRAGYKTLPRMLGFDGHRRTVSPGIYELTRDSGLMGGHVPASYINVLQSDAHCHKVLAGKQETRRIELDTQGIKIDIGNVPGNDGDGEDRLAIDKVDMDLVKEKKKEMAQGGTWWGKWHDIVHAESEKGKGGDEMVLMSMFDGHGGAHVADLMTKTMHACVAWGIANDPHAAAGQEDAIIRVLRNTYVCTLM